MTQENLKAFLQKVRRDGVLRARFQDAKCESCVVDLAQESGFVVDVDTVVELLGGQSLEALKAVVAGAGDHGSGEDSIWPMSLSD